MILKVAELNVLEREIETIQSEMDWRDPNLEAGWFDWANARIMEIISILEKSLYWARRRKLQVISRD